MTRSIRLKGASLKCLMLDVEYTVFVSGKLEESYRLTGTSDTLHHNLNFKYFECIVHSFCAYLLVKTWLSGGVT